MIMADVLKIFLLVAGGMIVSVAYWLVGEALFPRLVARAAGAYERRPLRSLLLGAVLGAPFVAMAMGLASVGTGPAQFGALVLAALPLFAGLFGSTALCRRIGQGLASPVDAEQPWRRVLRGGIVLVFVFLLPFIGWFLVSPAVLLSGLGAAVLGPGKAAEEAAEASAP